MDDLDLDKLMKQVMKDYEKEVLSDKQLQDDLVDLYQQSIEESVYDKYEPKKYKRTNQLKNDISVKFMNNSIYIYTDTTKMNYRSAVDDSNVSEWVPYWIQGGHDDDSSVDNMYHHYPSRKFLEKAQELIKEKYPYLKIEKVIINN